jgi:hypothetical protein
VSDTLRVAAAAADQVLLTKAQLEHLSAGEKQSHQCIYVTNVQWTGMHKVWQSWCFEDDGACRLPRGVH